MPGGGSKPGERRGGRQRGTPNKTLTERAQALAAKVAKAEARANAKLVALAHAIQAIGLVNKAELEHIRHRRSGQGQCAEDKLSL
jgi:hypothetical protein